MRSGCEQFLVVKCTQKGPFVPKSCPVLKGFVAPAKSFRMALGALMRFSLKLQVIAFEVPESNDNHPCKPMDLI